MRRATPAPPRSSRAPLPRTPSPATPSPAPPSSTCATAWRARAPSYSTRSCSGCASSRLGLGLGMGLGLGCQAALLDRARAVRLPGDRPARQGGRRRGERRRLPQPRLLRTRMGDGCAPAHAPSPRPKLPLGDEGPAHGPSPRPKLPLGDEGPAHGPSTSPHGPSTSPQACAPADRPPSLHLHPSPHISPHLATSRHISPGALQLAADRLFAALRHRSALVAYLGTPYLVVV